MFANTKNIVKVGTNVNAVSKVAKNALGSSVAAGQAAKKAGFDALYAQTLSSAAKANAATNAAKIGKALGALGALTSIVSTLATGAALAALTAQVAKLTKQGKARDAYIKQVESNLSGQLAITQYIVEANRIRSTENERISKRNSELFIDLDKRVKVANSNIDTYRKEVISLINQTQTSLDAKIAENNAKVEKQIEDFQAKTNTEFASINKEIKQANLDIDRKITAVKNELEKAVKEFGLEGNNKKNSEVEALRGRIAGLDTRIQSNNGQIEALRKKGFEQNKEFIKRTRSLNDKVTNFDTDIQTLKGGQVNLKSSLEGTSRARLK